jgi:UDP-arabinose 4-epimerase
MRVLVPGGAGYIGSHTCQILKEQGFQPVVYDNLVYGHEWAVKWGPFVRGDIHDTARLIQCMKDHQIDGVIHFAAFTYVGESVKDPLKYYFNNVSGTVSLLLAMKEAGVNRLVFSSTAAVYGNPKKLPIQENDELKPINPYGQTKLAVEKMLGDLGQSDDFKSISLRYFNACGASQTGEIGEDHQPETHLIPLAIRAAYDEGYTLILNGRDFETPDGTCIRDYVHVCDLADAHVKAFQYLDKMKEGYEVFNLGTNKGYSNKEIIAAVEDFLKVKVKVNIGPRRAGDPAVLVAANSKAKEILKWEIKSDLKEIIVSAGRWHQKQHFSKR